MPINKVLSRISISKPDTILKPATVNNNIKMTHTFIFNNSSQSKTAGDLSYNVSIL